jgi:hypothetical protein
MMTPSEVEEIAGQGHEIGSHSVTHPDLTTVSDAQLASELQDSKAALEAIPGVGRVTDFAYPFGAYDARVIAAEQTAGYSSGRSVEEGYNSRLDLQPYDIRVQNMLPTTTLAQFKGWLDYAKANNYWLVIVYHEVQKDGTPLCQNPNDDPALPTDPDPCVGPYDTTLGEFQQQLDYIASVGLGPDVMTVGDALNAANSQIHSPTAGTVAITPTQPTTGATLTATPSGFSDSDNATLTYTYSWTVNGAAVPGATDATGAQFTVPQVKHGDTIAVTVSARNAAGYVSTGANDIVTVPNSPPAVGSVTIGPSAPTAGTALKATPSGFADADGDALTYEYAWFENGQPISGVTGSTLPGSSVLTGTVSVEVRAVDGYGGRSDPANAAMVVTAASPGGQSNPGAGQPTPGGGQPTPGGGHPTPVVDKTPPQIVVMSPTRPIYRLGQTLLLKFACSDGSGVADCSATLGLVSGKPGSVRLNPSGDRSDGLGQLWHRRCEIGDRLALGAAVEVRTLCPADHGQGSRGQLRIEDAVLSRHERQDPSGDRHRQSDREDLPRGAVAAREVHVP